MGLLLLAVLVLLVVVLLLLVPFQRAGDVGGVGLVVGVDRGAVVVAVVPVTPVPVVLVAPVV